MSQESLFDSSELEAPNQKPTRQTAEVEAMGEVGTPLAARMRPRALDEFVGQEQVVGPGRLLRRAIASGQLPSLILWGPPGSGKTTLAQIMARATQFRFIGLSAVTAGVADLRKAIDEARKLRPSGQRTMLFIDEIHRFHKGQQDAVLHAVERGDVVLVGATTENPSFEVTNALLSRCRVVVLQALSEAEVGQVVDRALADEARGLATLRVRLAAAARTLLLASANGDARVALNALELAALSAELDQTGERLVTLPLVEEALQRRALLYDRAGDEHYQVISAFIKSIRGSDPDAAVYWLARLLEAGEDPLFVARRLVILAAEDVGLADPRALPLAVAAQQASHFVGMPEALYPLTEATLYLAIAPKSNSAKRAYDAARADVEATLNEPVPLHLRNAVTGLQRRLGYGQGYAYSHDYAEDDAARYRQQYLPDGLRGRRYYEPGRQGEEQRLAEAVRRVRELRSTSGDSVAESERP